MKKIFTGAATAALLFVGSIALAAPPNSSITGKDAAAATVTLGAVSDGTLKSPSHSLVDSTGAVISPATSGNQTTANTSLGSIDTKLSNQATAANQTAANTKLDTVHTDLVTLNTTMGGAIPSGSAIIGKVGIDQTTDGTTNAVHLTAGSAVAGKFGIDQTTPGVTNAVQAIAGTSGGTTAYGLQTAASTNATSVKGSAGVLYGMNLLNTTTTIYYLRMYDSAAAPTCSSATNFVRTWPVPPAAASGGGGGIAVSLPVTGTQFSNGIGFCVTGGPTSTDNTSAATGVFINLDYK